MHVIDVFHDMDVTVTVEAGRVADIAGAMARYPNATCPGAAGALVDMIGRPLGGAARALAKAAMSRHCTHLRDCAVWTLAVLERGEGGFVVEFAVTDADDAGRQHLTMTRDGVVCLAFELEAMTIRAPSVHAGRAMFGGFNRWVEERFAGREADDWRMAQMAAFVARGRRWLVDLETRVPVGRETGREGVCHAFSRPSFPDALSMVGYTRDFSSGLPPLAEG